MILRSGEGSNSFNKNNRSNFSSKKVQQNFLGLLFSEKGQKNLWVVHAHKSKGLYFRIGPCERNSSLIKVVQYLSCEEAAWNQRQEILLSCKYSLLTSFHAVRSGHLLGSLRYGDYGLRLRLNMLLRMIKTTWLFISRVVLRLRGVVELFRVVGTTENILNQWKVPAILLFYKKINSATWKEQKN